LAQNKGPARQGPMTHRSMAQMQNRGQGKQQRGERLRQAAQNLGDRL